MQCHGWSSSLARRENWDKVLKNYLKCLVSLKLILWAFPSKPQNEARTKVLWPVSQSFLGIFVSGKETYLKANVARHAHTVSEFKVHLTMAAKAWDTVYFGISEDLKDEDMYYLRKKQHVLLHTTISYDLNLWVKYSNYFSMSSAVVYFKKFQTFVAAFQAEEQPTLSAFEWSQTCKLLSYTKFVRKILTIRKPIKVLSLF